MFLKMPIESNLDFKSCKVDGLVKSLLLVMPDLIRHPEVVEFTGFRPSPE
jgi:hypothetical protein